MANAMPSVDWRGLPPFLELIGVQDLPVEQGSAEVSLIFDPSRHANGIGVAHGGVICTLLDVVMGYSAFHSGDQPSPIVTVEQSVQFVGVLNGRVRATGRVNRAGRSLVFCSGEIRSDTGKLVASGMGTFQKVVRAYEQHAGSQEAERPLSNK